MEEKMEKCTFKDIREFIKIAPVDWFGYHRLGHEYSNYIVHVYCSKNECNIIHDKTGVYQDMDILGKLIFRDYENTVVMYNIRNGICEFKRRIEVPINSEITPDLILTAYRSHNTQMFKCLMHISKLIKNN